MAEYIKSIDPVLRGTLNNMVDSAKALVERVSQDKKIYHMVQGTAYVTTTRPDEWRKRGYKVVEEQS